MKPSRPKWPKPEEILAVWDGGLVPEVEIAPLDAELHYPSLAWLERRSGKQLTDNSSPARYTALMMMRELPPLPRPVKVAFKIHGYCLWMEMETAHDMLRPIYRHAGL